MDLDKYRKDLAEWVESDKGKAYFEKMKQKIIIQQERFKRFEEWLKDADFDRVMYRIILEHGNEYQDKCYHNGFEPHPNRKLSFLINYITENLETVKVKKLDCDFPNDIWLFQDYYFQNIHGQGVITRIYNKEDMRMLLQI